MGRFNLQKILVTLAPHPSPLPVGEGASKVCLDRSCAVAGSMVSMADVRNSSPCKAKGAK